MSSAKVVLILGSGPNIGHSVSRAFAAKGYKVALASRSVKQEDNNAEQINFQVDLSNPPTVSELFAKVKETVGVPSVVIYNGTSFTWRPQRLRDVLMYRKAGAATANDPKDTFSLSLEQFTRDLNINTTSPFVAAKEAVQAFAQLPASASKTFIYTGNITNTAVTFAPLMTLGAGKSATAHMIQNASTVYADRGFK